MFLAFWDLDFNCHLDFEIWNLASEIAAPRQVGARNDTQPSCHCEASSSFVVARHDSAEAISVGTMGLPRFARNDTLPSVVARHDSAEAISAGAMGLPRTFQVLAMTRGKGLAMTPPLCRCEARQCRSNLGGVPHLHL